MKIERIRRIAEGHSGYPPIAGVRSVAQVSACLGRPQLLNMLRSVLPENQMYRASRPESLALQVDEALSDD
jgi:hypothetical protein